MRHLWLWAAALALTAGWTGGAFAQTTPTTAFPADTEVTLGTEKYPSSEEYVYLGAAECEGDTPITIRLPMATSASKVMEVWIGESGDDCTLGTNRNLTGGEPNTATCREVESAGSNDPGTRPTVSTSARKLFGLDDTKTCGDEGERWVYVLLLESGSDPDMNDNVTDASKYRKIGFKVDVTAPPAPTKVGTNNGESEVRITWDLPDDLDDEDRSKVRVYWDATAKSSATDPTCSSTLLKAGMEPMMGAGSREINRASSWSTSPNTLGLATNEKIPVAVVAVDETGNPSKLSEVKCVAKVDTRGFCELNSGTTEAGDCGDDFDTCSALPWRGVGSLWSALALSVSALLLSRRRRWTGREVHDRSAAIPLRRNV